MNPSDYINPAAGRVVRHTTGYHAFIPALLPLKIELDGPIALALSRADAALGELSGLGRLLPNPHLLIAPLMRREAVSSSRIEGTRASLSEVLLDEAETEARPASADVAEVRNYVAALEHGLRRMRAGELPLSNRLVREMHARLMQGVRGEHSTPGEFRRSQNWIGPAGSTPMTAPYVPPPPEELPELLSNWERFLHERDVLPDLVQCAIMHEQFEAIHPFLDGNGRIGRVLVTLFLIERQRLIQPALYLSDYIEAHRQDYYDLLQRVRTHGDWTSWLRFFLACVTATARDAAGRAGKIMDLREKYRGLVAERAAATALVDRLFVNPYLTVAHAMRVLKVTHPTASRAIGELEKMGVLKEVSGRRRGRVYLAAEILDVLEKPGPAASVEKNTPKT
jgi:Fic family protein